MEDSTHSSLSDAPLVDEPTPTAESSGALTNSTELMLPPPKLSRDSSSTSVAAISKKFQSASTSTSQRASREPSREASPVRASLRPATTGKRTSSSRSRQNSKTDISPSRSASNPPSAAAIQRALSAASTPTLPQPETSIRSPVPQKPMVATEPRDPHRWPVSPRLRSPPPISKSSLNSPRRTEDGFNHRALVAAALTSERSTATDSEDETPATGTRTPIRAGANSTLETVQEASLPSTPAIGSDAGEPKTEDGKRRSSDEQDPMEMSFTKSLASQRSSIANDSGSDSGGKSDAKRPATSSATAAPNLVRPTGALANKAHSTPNSGRSKQTAEGSTKNMTVETETVSSIPQVAVGAGAGPVNGSLRAKPSSETIRPKKERKRARKPPSVNAGTASSKADIFEAKIASAVDEANSSDSDETFVYESNPPEHDRPRRYHSRTPSATSMASQADQRPGRNLLGLLEGGHTVAMKKSMKFVNSYNSSNPETGTDEDGKGTVRSSAGTGRGTSHHHHIGRWGRNGGNGHASLFDNESPFSSTKSKLGNNNSRVSSRPSSPRVLPHTRLMGSSKKASSAYDLDETTGADDERTPLLPSSARSYRSIRTRRNGGSSLRQLEHQAARQQRSFLTRFAGCLVFTIMIILVMSGAIGFLFASTTPLVDVKIMALKHVLASQQEIMLDLVVSAQNPNVVAITVDSMNIEVFARSTYLDANWDWWKEPASIMKRKRATPQVKPLDDVQTLDDDPTDPPVEDPEGAQTIKLGTISQFDSPLYFDGSPFRHLHRNSTGEVRLSKPGNHTDSGGTEQWHEVLQHDFELIIRGVLKYNLPLTNRIHSVSVAGRTMVKSNQADNPEKLYDIHLDEEE